MDHIPFPINPVHAHLQIPYAVLPEHTYDGLGFAGFPARNGVNPPQLRYGNFAGGWTESLSILQSWLYFGMLVEVLSVSGIEVRIEDFVVEDGDQRWVTSKSLPDLLRLWQDKERSRRARIRTQHWEAVNGIILAANQFAGDVIRDWKYGPPWTGADGETTLCARAPDAKSKRDGELVLLSITVLGEALGTATGEVFRSVHEKGRLTGFPHVPLIDELMRLAGWCPNEMATLRERLDHLCQYYLSALDRRSLAELHDRCTAERCYADEMDENTYQVQHVRDGCACQLVDVGPAGQARISQLLARDEIPVARLSYGSRSNTPTVEIISTRPYVAISHVWSDGMGNPRGNALLECQLRRLQTWADMLYGYQPLENGEGKVPFWIDTLCVPLDGEVRKTAIMRMQQTYMEADIVLVIDSTLLPYTVQTDAIELMMRIGCSKWVRRLWTLQEGVMAETLRFQFLDGSPSREELDDQYFADKRLSDVRRFPHLCKDPSSFRRHFSTLHRAVQRFLSLGQSRRSPFLNLVAKSLPDKDPGKYYFPIAGMDPLFIRSSGYVRYVEGVFLREGPIHQRIAALNAPLKSRSTSKPEDESICLATLLFLPEEVVRALLDTPPDPPQLRMLALFSCFFEFPAEIIFGNAPRVQGEPGWGWLPVSFLKADPDFQTTSPQMAKREAEGLVVEYPGVHLRNPAGSGGYTEQGPKRLIHIVLDGELYSVLLKPTEAGWGKTRLEELALVWRFAAVDWIQVPAVMVHVAREEDRTLYGKFHASGWIAKSRQVQIEKKGLTWENCIKADRVPATQRWCIG